MANYVDHAQSRKWTEEEGEEFDAVAEAAENAEDEKRAREY